MTNISTSTRGRLYHNKDIAIVIITKISVDIVPSAAPYQSAAAHIMPGETKKRSCQKIDMPQNDATSTLNRDIITAMTETYTNKIKREQLKVS